MEDLRELVRLVNRNKTKNIELLDLQGEARSLPNRLYQAISNGEVQNEKEARSFLNPEGMSSNAFSNVKGQLRRRLLDTSLFIDLDNRGYTDRQAAYFKLQKEMATAKILLAKSAFSSAIDVLEKNLVIAQKFEFTEEVVQLSRILRLQFATRKKLKKKYDKYEALYEEYISIDYWENEAEIAYGSLMFYYRTNKKKY